VVKDKKGDMVTDPNSILASWRNHFSQLLNVHGINYVRQREMRTAYSLVPESSAFEFEMVIEKIKNHKSPGTDQMPAKLTKVGRAVRSDVNKLINFIWIREELPEK